MAHMQELPRTKELRREIAKYRRKFGLQSRTPCTDEENRAYLDIVNSGRELPEGVGRFKIVNGDYLNEFFTVQETDLTKEEQQEYLRFRELEMLSTSTGYLRTIRNCVVFFTALAVIGFVIAAFGGFFTGLLM